MRLALVLCLPALCASCATIIGADFNGYTRKPADGGVPLSGTGGVQGAGGFQGSGGTGGRRGSGGTSCDPVTGTPCSTGTRCYLDTTSSTASCTADIGTRGVSQECASSVDCAGQTYCIGFASSGYYCSQYCRVGSADCGTTSCLSLGTPQYVNGVEYGICEPPDCNPFDPSAGSPFIQCPGSLTCRFATSYEGRCQDGSGTTPAASPCQESRDCQTGLVCVFWSGQGSCYPACRPSLGKTGNPDCVGYTYCYNFTTTNVMSGLEVGYCGN